MTNQQLKAHCEDVIANPQDHLDWVVDMARVALASLEVEPVAWATMQPNLTEDERTVFTKKDLADRFSKICYDLTPLYPAPPVPELKSVELPEMIYVREPGFIGYVYDADEIEEALKRNGIEVKS